LFRNLALSRPKGLLIFILLIIKNLFAFNKNLSLPILCFSLCFIPLEKSSAKETVKLIFTADMNEIGSEYQGGYAQVASLLAEHRQQDTPVFFIFGGASIGPSMLSNLDRGSHIIDLLNSLEPDVMAVTKRDFSFLEDELSLRAVEAAFPLVASNILEIGSKENLSGLLKSAIVEQGKYSIGILSTMSTAAINEYGLKRISILDKHFAVKSQAQILKAQGVDLVLLINTGIKDDVSTLLDDGTIDLILQKDSNASIRDKNNLPNNARYVFLSNSNDIALIQLQWQVNRPKSLKATWQVLQYKDLNTQPKMKAQVEGYVDRLSLLLDEVIGINLTSYNTKRANVRLQENAFGNMLADTLRNFTKADVALINGGTIRGERSYLIKSAITRRDITKELPYRNKVILLKVTGSQILQALEHGLSGLKDVLGRFPHLSGLQVTYDRNQAIGKRIVSVQINKKELKFDTLYTLATSDYLAGGGDGYAMFSQAERLHYKGQMNALISSLLVDEIRNLGTISPQIEGRMLEVKVD